MSSQSSTSASLLIELKESLFDFSSNISKEAARLKRFNYCQHHSDNEYDNENGQGKSLNLIIRVFKNEC